jgi:hypothetical protein
MTKKLSSIDHLAAVTARQAQSSAAGLQRDLRALRDGISGLSRAIRAPVPKGGSRTIKGSRSSINPLLAAAASSLARYAVNSYFADDGDQGGNAGNGGAAASFYKSEAQTAGSAFADLITGQRIR